MKTLSKSEVIAALGLDGHFEGGYFRETFRPTHREKLQTARGMRGTMTSIYYMLTDDSPSTPSTPSIRTASSTITSARR